MVKDSLLVVLLVPAQRNLILGENKNKCCVWNPKEMEEALSRRIASNKENENTEASGNVRDKT